MGDIVDLTQAGFIHNRIILGNILLAIELIKGYTSIQPNTLALDV